jgi:hypothetical protein
MKKAFEQTKEAVVDDDLIKLTTELIKFQRKEDLKIFVKKYYKSLFCYKNKTGHPKKN